MSTFGVAIPLLLFFWMRQRQCVAETPAHVERQRHQILVTARDPFERFLFVSHEGMFIPVQVIRQASQVQGAGRETFFLRQVCSQPTSSRTAWTTIGC